MRRKLSHGSYRSAGLRHRRRSPLALVGILVSTALVLLGATSVLWSHIFRSHAAQAQVNMNCTLIVPAHPLTAQGLATPYLLTATDPDQGPCNETNANQAAFVQAAVVNATTGFLAVYDPLVIDQGMQPATNPATGAPLNPVVPVIPTGSVVAIWFGFNGNTLTLQGAQGDATLRQSHCVSGLPGSPFTQFSYCNAVKFFRAANTAIAAGKLVPPALGSGQDGLVCPTVRDFALVDQDQSDNVTTTYLQTTNGQLAQNTAVNAAALQGSTPQVNGSDNRLLDVGIDGALGCTPWMVPDLANPGHTATALPLNELQAAAHQAPPVAVVPALDPMVVVTQDNSVVPNLTKVNLYRVGVDQPVVQTLAEASTKDYCLNLQQVAPRRLALDAPLTGQKQPPDPAVGNTLFTFLAQRYVNTFTGPLGTNLACQQQFHLQPRVATQQDGNGVAISAIIKTNGRKQCFNSQGIASPMSLCKHNAQLMQAGSNNGQSTATANDTTTPEPTISSTPSPSDSPTDSPTSSPTDAPAASPTPTDTPKGSPTSTGTTTSDSTPTVSPTPSPTAQGQQP